MTCSFGYNLYVNICTLLTNILCILLYDLLLNIFSLTNIFLKGTVIATLKKKKFLSSIKKLNISNAMFAIRNCIQDLGWLFILCRFVYVEFEFHCLQVHKLFLRNSQLLNCKKIFSLVITQHFKMSVSTMIYWFFQVHKEPISVIPNSLPHRGDTEVEIYGMEGIPEKDVEDKRKQKQKTKAAG